MGTQKEEQVQLPMAKLCSYQLDARWNGRTPFVRLLGHFQPQRHWKWCEPAWYVDVLVFGVATLVGVWLATL